MQKPGPPQPLSAGVRRLTLEAAGVTLSCLLAEPSDTGPRATVLALHGGGMTASYFDGQAHPDLSLLTLGARLGFTVLAVDRPGYGLSAGRLPDGQTLAEQAVVLEAAMEGFAARHATGAGLFLLAHSYGGKLALMTAARGTGPLAVDVSGCGRRYAAGPDDLRRIRGGAHWGRNWGPLRLYPPETFRAIGAVVAPMPAREASEIPRWTGMFEELAPRVRTPVRLTFAEHEAWWRHGERDIAEITSRLASASVVRVERQPGAGHNISLGWAARAYHLRALAFFEECLAGPRPPAGARTASRLDAGRYARAAPGEDVLAPPG